MTDDVWCGAEADTPETIAQDDHWRLSRPIVPRIEEASQRRGDAERVEIVSAHELGFGHLRAIGGP